MGEHQQPSVNGAQIFPSISSDLEKLVQEDRLQRILRPDIKEKLEQVLKRDQESARYIIQQEDSMYVSLESIDDEAQRHQIYRLLQRYQTGEPVNLAGLPPALRRLFLPETTRLGRVLGALVLGAFVGLGIGILAMALCILGLNVMVLVTHTAVPQFAGMSLSVIVFVVFAALGWSAAAIIAYNKM